MNLVLNVNKITADNGRTLTAPTKLNITGVSMGGHITAAAINTGGVDDNATTVGARAFMPACPAP